MAVHAEHSLAGSRISQVLNLFLAVAATKAAGTICLVAGKNGEILDLVAAGAAAVCAVVADKGAIAKEEQVCVRVKNGATGVALEALEMPSMASCGGSASRTERQEERELTEFKGLAFLQYVATSLARIDEVVRVQRRFDVHVAAYRREPLVYFIRQLVPLYDLMGGRQDCARAQTSACRGVGRRLYGNERKRSYRGMQRGCDQSGSRLAGSVRNVVAGGQPGSRGSRLKGVCGDVRRGFNGW